MWMSDRIPNPRLCREMDHAIRFHFGKRTRHFRAVGDLNFLKMESLSREALQSGFLKIHVVIVVQVVHAPHFISTI